MSYPPGPPRGPRNGGFTDSDPGGSGAPPQWGSRPPSPGAAPPSWAPPPPPSVPEQPSSIKSAVALMWGGAAVTLLAMPLAFIMRDEVRDLVAEDQPSLSSSELDTAVAFGLVAAVIGGVIGIALWSLNAVFCGKGQSWSRILGTVLFGISLLSLPFNLIQPAPAISRVFQVVSLLISIGAVVFLWLPESSRFFRESDAARRAGAYRY